jgi:hypothetical protein
VVQTVRYSRCGIDSYAITLVIESMLSLGCGTDSMLRPSCGIDSVLRPGCGIDSMLRCCIDSLLLTLWHRQLCYALCMVETVCYAVALV